MNGNRRPDAIALAILAAVITLAFADVLTGVNSLYVRDLVHFHYPTKAILREIVLGGEFPHWNPWLGAGQPMAANPQHEVFYPPNWLILLPGYRAGFHLLVVLHLYLAAFSMYALLRSMALRTPAAFFGALSFALGGAGLSYLNLLPFLFSIAWLPLTCLYTRRFLKTRSRRAFALASLFFGIQVLIGEPTTILQTGILLGLYALFQGAGGRAQGAGERSTGLLPPAPRALRPVLAVGLISVAALLVSAVQTVPAIDLAADSVRARGIPFEDVTEWSFPPVRLAEFFHPNLMGHVDVERGLYWAASHYPKRGLPFLYSIYPGLLLSVLALAGVFARLRGRGLFGAAAGIGILLALGAHTPLWRLLYDAGLAKAVRYPEKFILLALFAVLLFGSRALDELLGGNETVRRSALRVAAVIAAILALAAVFSRTPLYPPFFAWLWEPRPDGLGLRLAASATGLLVALARAGAVLLLVRNVVTARRTVWLAVAGAFVLLDLGLLFPEAVPRMPSRYYDPPAMAQLLPRDRTPWRLFHHASWHRRRDAAQVYRIAHEDRMWVNRNAMYPLIPAQYGIRLALETDYDLTSLTPTADFLQSAADLTHLRRDWADVVASMSNVWYRAVFRDPREAFAQARGDLRVLQPVGLLAMPRHPRYWFAEGLEPIADRADFVRKAGSGRFPTSTVFVRGEAFAPAAGRVTRVTETANTARIEAETSGRAFLAISVTPHKYWRITINGREAQAVPANVGYQGVIVPTAGKHVIEMRYRNPLFVPAGAISLATLLALALLAMRVPRVPRSSSEFLGETAGGPPPRNPRNAEEPEELRETP
ncbi:MAG TPA: hypothetical protein VF432_22525 [Thermoanaerobaculia bacterium]